MAVYFLRHEKRPKDDQSFYTNLTVEGHYNADNKLKKTLTELKITKIYCSPFMRCLQTVYPYAKENNIKVNVDWGIQECFHNHIFHTHNYTKLSDQEKEFYNVNPKYKSSMEPNVLRYQETYFKLLDRVTDFFIRFKLENRNSDENILICTHMGVLNVILGLFKLNRKVTSLYLMGRVSTIKNGKLIYKN